MKENIIKLLSVILMVLVVWGLGNFFSNSVEQHKIVEPVDGIECIIVSRSFNTSVDCWRKEDE